MSHHQPQSVLRVYTFKHEAIFVMVQVQEVKTTQYTTSRTKSLKPNSNPNVANYTIYQNTATTFAYNLPKTIQLAAGGFYSYMPSNKPII